MLVGGIVVEGRVDHLAGWHGALDVCTARDLVGLLVLGFPGL